MNVNKLFVAGLLVAQSMMADTLGQKRYKEIFTAVQNCDEKKLNHLLSKNSTLPIDDIRESDRATLLHIAAARGNRAMVDILLDKGADINTQDENGYTPLHRSVICANEETAQRLVERGAGVNKQDKSSGYTPLHLAVARCNKNLVSILLEAGADVEIKSQLGVSPLNGCIDPEIRKLLVRAKEKQAQKPVK